LGVIVLPKARFLDVLKLTTVISFFATVTINSFVSETPPFVIVAVSVAVLSSAPRVITPVFVITDASLVAQVIVEPLAPTVGSVRFSVTALVSPRSRAALSLATLPSAESVPRTFISNVLVTVAVPFVIVAVRVAVLSSAARVTTPASVITDAGLCKHIFKIIKDGRYYMRLTDLGAYNNITIQCHRIVVVSS
jgi:hypothetical protein